MLAKTAPAILILLTGFVIYTKMTSETSRSLSANAKRGKEMRNTCLFQMREIKNEDWFFTKDRSSGWMKISQRPSSQPKEKVSDDERRSQVKKWDTRPIVEFPKSFHGRSISNRGCAISDKSIPVQCASSQFCRSIYADTVAQGERIRKISHRVYIEEFFRQFHISILNCAL